MNDFWTYPDIDPVAFSLGPLDIRWYSLAYMAAFLIGWRYCMYLAGLDKNKRPTPEHIDNFLLWIVAGVILGGRIGYILFYNLGTYLAHPESIFKVWQGGMSFHGGLLGVVIVIIWYSKRHNIPILRMGDIISCATPIGFFFGRLANFINGELYGRITDSPLGMVFPHGGPYPRHPSQLYEALFEGLVLFILLLVLAHQPNFRHKDGFLFGVLMAFYGLARFGIEFFREPDAHLGFIAYHMSMGQILSLPMILIGGFLMVRSLKEKTVSRNKSAKSNDNNT